MARVDVAALRAQVELALANRVTAPFNYRDRKVGETVSTGIPEMDALTGGLPRGALTEIYGPACSGRTSVLVAALASRTAADEACALIDGRDSFDPYSAAAAGVELSRLLWVRCRNIEQALRATDLLLQGGGFGMVALDLGDIPEKTVRYVQLNTWFRFRRAVEDTPTIFIVVERESNAKTCASLVLRMEARARRWVKTGANAETADASTSACVSVEADAGLGASGRADRNQEEKNFRETHTRLFQDAEIWAEMVRSRAGKAAATNFYAIAMGNALEMTKEKFTFEISNFKGKTENKKQN